MLQATRHAANAQETRKIESHGRCTSRLRLTKSVGAASAPAAIDDGIARRQKSPRHELLVASFSGNSAARPLFGAAADDKRGIVST